MMLSEERCSDPPSYPKGFNLTRYVLFDQLQEYGEKAAVVFPQRDTNDFRGCCSRSFTYRQLAAKVCQSRRFLEEEVGCEFGNTFACLCSDSLEYVSLIFAVISMGGQLQPHSSSTNMENKLAPLLNDFRSNVLICDEGYYDVIVKLQPSLKYLKKIVIIDISDAAAHDSYYYDQTSPAGDARQDKSKYDAVEIPASGCNNGIKVSDFHAKIGKYSTEMIKDDRLSMTDRDDVAIWSSTSGTTGTPKGVIHSQVDYCFAADTYAKTALQMSSSDIITTPSPCQGTYAIPILWFALRHGATFVFLRCKSMTPMYAPLSLPAFHHHQISILFAQPSRIQEFVDEKISHPDTCSFPKSMKCIVSAGFSFPLRLHQDFVRLFGILPKILDGVGASEMGHIFITNHIDDNDAPLGSVGKLVKGYSFKICDEDGGIVKIGEVGRLWIKPSAVSYFNNHEGSQQTFIDGYCKMSDLYSWDGKYFTFLGRCDDMIKLPANGVRVSPLEIEAVVNTHPCVAQSCLTLLNANDGSYPKTCVFLLISTENQPQLANKSEFEAQLTKELTTLINEKLEYYKVPNYFRILDSFPYTQRGKLDRRGLRSYTISS